MSEQSTDLRALARENAALRTRVKELEHKLARFKEDEPAPVGSSLAEREALLSEAERIAHMGSWVWNPSSGEVKWSDEMFRIWGYEPDAIVPTVEAYYARIHPDDISRMSQAANRGLETGESEQVTFRVVHPSGELRQVVVNSVLLFDQAGNLKRAVGTALDITEQQRLEEQLRHAQKMEAIGRLAGGVAHDFNNLLTVIAGSAETLSVRIQAEELDDIRKAAEGAASLTKQLLAFGRRAVLERRALNLNEEINASKNLLENATRKQISLQLDFEPELWPARLDRGQLQQILMNLVVNARDAMPAGGTVTLRTRNVSQHITPTEEIPGVELLVIDTGVGMDESTMTRVFEPFFTTKAEGAGTGLGLSMVFGAVQQNGGTISVVSRPGAGARFRLFFPRDLEAAPLEKPKTSAGHPARELLKGVLLVEDDPSVARVVARYLRTAGIDTAEALSSADALRLLQERSFDTLITDVQMKGTNGLELAGRARTLQPHLPILFMTGYATEELAELAALEPCSLLRKPFQRDDLVFALSELINRAR